MSDKQAFRSKPGAKLANAVVQGNTLIVKRAACTEAWDDLTSINRECTAMTTGPGFLLNFTGNPEFMAKVDAAAVEAGVAEVTTMLHQKQQDLIALRGRVKEHEQHAGKLPVMAKQQQIEDSLVAALDMGEEYNQWTDGFHRTVMVQTDQVLQHFRDALPDVQIPILSGHYQAFHPSEVGAGDKPLADPVQPEA